MYDDGAMARGVVVDDMVVSGRTRPGAGRDGDKDGYGYGDGGGRGGRRCEGGFGGEEGIGRVGENQDMNWYIKDT